MVATIGSKRAVFQSIADRSYAKWPACRDFLAYDRASLAGLGEAIRTVADQWFRHERHDDVDEFVRVTQPDGIAPDNEDTSEHD